MFPHQLKRRRRKEGDEDGEEEAEEQRKEGGRMKGRGSLNSGSLCLPHEPGQPLMCSTGLPFDGVPGPKKLPQLCTTS